MSPIVVSAWIWAKSQGAKRPALKAQLGWTFEATGTSSIISPFGTSCARMEMRLWKKLEGSVEIEEVDDGHSEIEVRLSGKTKGLVPEFAIRGQMEEQIQEMASAIEERLGA